MHLFFMAIGIIRLVRWQNFLKNLTSYIYHPLIGAGTSANQVVINVNFSEYDPVKQL